LEFFVNEEYLAIMNLMRKTSPRLAAATALSKSATSLSAATLLIVAQSLVLVPTTSAETLARANGRCKLTSDDYKAFDGYCTVKQKQQGGTTIFVVELDDGTHYRFYGPNKQALEVETHDGIHNVQFKEDPDKGVFTWEEDGDRNRLSVKLDTQHPPEASHDTPSDQAAGTAIGAAVGALIGNLLTGGGSKPTQPTPTATATANTPENLISTVPPALKDLVDARAGQAEGDLISRGYTYKNTETWDGGKTAYYVENKTGYCVGVATVDGRYSSIVYDSSDRCKPSN
jgi:hypothetical protein